MSEFKLKKKTKLKKEFFLITFLTIKTKTMQKPIFNKSKTRPKYVKNDISQQEQSRKPTQFKSTFRREGRKIQGKSL